MADKKIHWWSPEIGAQERRLVNQVITENYINEGDLTTEFEKRIANLLGVPFAIATTSGTVAIFLALKAVGVRYGDEVIVPDVTFVGTASAVDLCGAKPILVDIDPKTMNISVAAITKAINKKTKAIIPVHYTGRAADMTAILTIAKKYNLQVVEDAAEAFFSKHNGRYLGTFGAAGCFSFAANKTITTGQGGMIVTNNAQLAAKIRGLKNQGRPLVGGDIYSTRGYNFRLTNLQAAIGIGQLSYLKQRAKRMQRLHSLYAKELKNIKGIRILPFNIKGGEVPQWTDAIVERREKLVAYLAVHNIQSRPFWLPLHRQKPYCAPDQAFPNSTALCPKAIWLPSCFCMSDNDVRLVCKHIRNFFSHEK